MTRRQISVTNTNQQTKTDTLVEGGTRLGQRQLELQVDQFLERRNPDLLDISFGYIAINLTNPKILGPKVKHSPILWSRTMPLAWYFKRQWEYKYGVNGRWKERFCSNWHDKESFGDRFATTVFRCPCTRQQALLGKCSNSK